MRVEQDELTKTAKTREMQDGDDPDVLVFAGALECVECGRLWSDPTERWRMYVTDDEPPEAVPYCRDCASREFDP
jgi:hypothetical protein